MLYEIKKDIKEKEDFLEFFGQEKSQICKPLYEVKDGRELRQKIFTGSEFCSQEELHYVYQNSAYCTMFLNTITDGWFTNGIRGKKLQHLIFQLAEKKFPNPANCKVLDYGCGQGENGLGLAMLGYDVTFADIPHAYFKFLEFLCKKYLHELKITFLPIVQQEFVLTEMYDFIVSDEMLEHTFEPEQTLRHLSDHLVEGGWMYLSYFFDDMKGQDPSHLHKNYLRFNDAQRFVGIIVDNRLIPMVRDHCGVMKCYQKLNGKLE
jgi:SAM-dependent methyltransferase